MVNKHCSYGDCKSDSRYPKKAYMAGVTWVGFVKPKLDMERCIKWVHACGREIEDFNVGKVNKDTFLCSKHFVGGKGPTADHPDPIPRYYSSEKVKAFSHKRKDPKERSTDLQPAKCARRDDFETASVPAPVPLTAPAPVEEAPSMIEQDIVLSGQPDTADKCTQTLAPNCDLAIYLENKALKNEVALLRSEIDLLKVNSQPNGEYTSKPTANVNTKDTEHFFDVSDIENDDKKCKFYTGLTYLQFLTLWQFLGPAVHKLIYWNTQVLDAEKSPSKRKGAKRKLAPMTELLLTFVRLRMGLLHEDLAYRFGIASSTVSSIVITWVQFMYLRFQTLKSMMFADRSVIKEHLPKSFRKFKNVRVVIDCTEIFVQQATDFRKQGNLYSSYKSHSTFKVLVGIAPYGGIMFVSDAFEGSISDRAIVEQSGFLDYIEEGDLVIADRGFTIKDLLHRKKANLIIPPFLSGRTKLTPQEEAQTKAVPKVRIHVERAIERMKKFRLLGKKLPLSLTPIFSQMTFVVGCLVNFQEPLVR